MLKRKSQATGSKKLFELREQLNEVLIMKNTPNSGSWLDAKVSLPLQLPRDIQLEYHSPPNW